MSSHLLSLLCSTIAFFLRRAQLTSRLALGVGVFFCFVAGGQAQTELTWTFGAAAPGLATPSSVLPADIIGGEIKQGNNHGTTPLLTTTSASDLYVGASASYNAGAAARSGTLNTAANGSAYFEFTLTPGAGKKLQASALSFGSRSTSTGPLAFAVYSSVDNFASPITSGVLVADNAWHLITPSFTATTGPVAAAVTFRLFGYNGAGSPRTNTANWRLDDLKLTVATLAAPPAVAIHDIQGAGSASPLVGQLVTVKGIVTASDQNATTGLGGFFMQAAEADYDSDANTSEGIFVFDAGSTALIAVKPGDVVSVSATVSEFGTAPNTLTELNAVTVVTKVGTAPLPAPVKLSLPLDSATSLEKYEGMRVVLPQTLTVTNNFDLGHFGEITLSNGRLPTPTNIVAPGAAAAAQEKANLLNQILLDDDSGVAYPDPTPFLINSGGQGPTLRGGATVTGVTGVLTFAFGQYLIEPTPMPVFADTNPRTPAAPNPGGSLRVVIGNVENDFNGDGAGGGFPTARGATTLAEYQRQRAKIVAGILGLAPDIMGLTEVENDGFGPTSTIQDIVNGLNASAPPGRTYAFVNASAVDNGTDLIHVAFIYRTEMVETVGNPAALTNQYFSGLARPPLAQTFRQKSSGEKLTVCINHFRAKGSAATSTESTDGLSPNPNLDRGDGQGTNNYLRKREAQTLTAWLATDPTGSGDPDFLIIGDLNSYAKEDPLVAIEGAGFVSLTERTEGVGGYSYGFKNEYGHLDHALASQTLAAQAVGAMSWHVNSDEPVYLDYNVENKSPSQQTLNVGTPYRYSDHDPVVIGLNLGATAASDHVSATASP